MSGHRAYFRSIAVSSLGNTAASALAAGLLLPLVIRTVGLDTYGQWAVIGLFINVSSLLDFGILKSVVYLVSRREFPVREVVGSALCVSVVACLVFGLLLALAVATDLPILGVVGRQHPEAVVWVCLSGMIVVAASLWANILRGLLEAKLRGDLVNAGYAILTLLLYGNLALLAWVGASVRWMLAGSATVYAVVALLHHWQLHALGLWPVCVPTRRSLRALLAFGWRSYATEVPVNLLFPIVLFLFVQVARGGADYAVLDLAIRICTLAGTALGALSLPLLALSAADTSGHAAHARGIATRFLRVTVALGVLGCLAYWAAGESLVRWVFRAEAHAVWLASMTMLPGAAAVAACEPIARWMLGAGRIGTLAIARYALVLGCIAGIALLAPRPPVDRFPMAVAVGYFASAALLVIGLLNAARAPATGSDRVVGQ